MEDNEKQRSKELRFITKYISDYITTYGIIKSKDILKELELKVYLVTEKVGNKGKNQITKMRYN
jgi:hypothetical protein